MMFNADLYNLRLGWMFEPWPKWLTRLSQAVNSPCEKIAFFKRLNFQKERFLMPEKRFFTACILK